MRVRVAVAVVAALISTSVACGSSSDPPRNDGSAGGTTGAAGTTGRGGTTGAAGTTGVAGTTGNAGTTGSAGRGGTTGGAGRGGTTGNAGTTGAGGSATQPIGAACVNTGMCSQADGPAVCCLQIQTCVLDSQCPTGGTFVSCATQPCARAGWVCCNSGGMQFCTKQSGCSP